MAKVEVQPGKVGFLANLHNVAYQGDEDLIGPFLTEAQTQFNTFRLKNMKSDETLAFNVICGDFNFDNISTGKLMEF